MEIDLAKHSTPEQGSGRRIPPLRGALVGAAAAALFVTSLFGQDAIASSPVQAQNTIPPSEGHTDAVSFSVFLPQMSAIDGLPPQEDNVQIDEDNASPDEGNSDGDIVEIVDGDDASGCPAGSDAVFESLPVVGPPIDHPPPINADLNLSVRGYVTATEPLILVDINGPTDSDPPQLSGIIANQNAPTIAAAYHVNGWDWLCVDDPSAPWYGHGCRGEPITGPEVTLLALEAEPETPVRVPSRQADIHSGGYVALVLYAEETRLTLVYTREDTPARGYVVHLEDLCVDASLLQLYRILDSAGRSWLPAVRNGEQLGSTMTAPVKAAIRDTGSYMDPRSRKDWWKGY